MVKELIIKIENNRVFLSPLIAIPFEQTNIPYTFCSFRVYNSIIWKVNLIEYNADNHCWKIKVVDYNAEDLQNFERQRSTRPVERLAFEKFDWTGLEPHLASYQKIHLLDVLEKQDVDAFFSSMIGESEWKETDALPKEIEKEFGQKTESPALLLNKTDESPPLIHRYNLEFNVKFSDATMQLGYITFQRHIREVNDSVVFKIDNDYLLPEFEHIKFWFSKKLKSKKFSVKARIITANRKVTEVLAKSDEIAMINEEFIASIKYQYAFQLGKPPLHSSPDKSLFTADELYEEMLSEQQGNIFNQNEQDLLQLFLENTNTRNKKQLNYLAGLKQSDKVKIRFTLNPNFGFIFFIEGETQNHFVWELLNSHATYLWSIDRSSSEIERQFKRIEASINSVRSFGREKYRQSYGINHFDKDLVFSVIEHDNISSALVDGFVKWKHRLNERLI
jgi:hypothetical protein